MKYSHHTLEYELTNNRVTVHTHIRRHLGLRSDRWGHEDLQILSHSPPLPSPASHQRLLVPRLQVLTQSQGGPSRPPGEGGSRNGSALTAIDLSVGRFADFMRGRVADWGATYGANVGNPIVASAAVAKKMLKITQRLSWPGFYYILIAIIATIHTL